MSEEQKNKDQDQISQIMSMMQTLDVSLKKAAREIESVENIASDLLRHANSPKFGLKHNIDRVDHALALLGQQRTIDFLENQLDEPESDSNYSSSKMEPEVEIELERIYDEDQSNQN